MHKSRNFSLQQTLLLVLMFALTCIFPTFIQPSATVQAGQAPAIATAFPGTIPAATNRFSGGLFSSWQAFQQKLNEWFTGEKTPAIPEQTTSNFIHTEGSQIVDANGNPYQLKGIGMGNNVWYSQNQLPTADHDKESFAELEALGFNSVRFYLNASLFESDAAPYQYNEEAFEWLDNNVTWAKEHNIRLLFNMHIPQGGKVTSANTAFWDNPDNQKRFIALWSEIAGRYAEEDAVLGYGLMNEPFVPECSSPEAALNLYYTLMEDTVAAIRRADKNHMLFLERPYGTVNTSKNTTNYVWGTTDSFRLISDSNTVYEFHFYDCTEFTHQGLSWLDYNDTWIYNTDNIALLSGARQLSKICKANAAVDITSATWQHVETAPIQINVPNANYGYWIIYLNNMGNNANTYIDNLVIKEYDENGVYLRDLHTCDFNPVTPCAGWDLGSGGGGSYRYNANGGTDGSGCAQISNVTASYRFYRQYAANGHFSLNPNHTYSVCADVRLENVTDAFSLELGIQTGICENTHIFDKEYLRSCLQQFLTFGETNHVALYLGEFGVTRHVMDDTYRGAAWVEDVFDLINEYNLSYSYHDYHEENFGLYINDSRAPRSEMNQTLYNIFQNKL